MAEKVTSQIEFEIEQIDTLLESYAALLERAQQGKPNLIEQTALASVLHSFYNGIENIFLRIAKQIDDEVPSGERWHQDLLQQMAKRSLARKAVLSARLKNHLADYLGFRHFFRHSYSFFLEWEEMEKLVTPLADVWQQVKKEINRFVATLGKE